MKKQPAYVAKLEKLGLDVPIEILKSFRGFILNPEATLPYMAVRMDRQKPDLRWVDKVSQGSKARVEMESAGADKDAIIDAAVKEGQQVMGKPSQHEQLEGLAFWFDRWVGDQGKVQLRNSINAKVHYQLKGRKGVALHPATADKLNRFIAQSDDIRTADEAVNYLLHHIENAKGIKL